MRSVAVYLGVAMALAAGSYSEAHHSNAPHYDRDKPVTIEGVVTRFDFINPHAFVFVETTTEDGVSEVWKCELSTANTLRRRGWSEDQFVPGQVLTLTGIAARRDPTGCSFNNAVFDDGSTITQAGGVTPPEIENATELLSALAGGIPNLSGPWVRQSGRGQGRAAPEPQLPGVRAPGPRDDLPADEFFTPEGLAAQQPFDQRFDDPSFDCSASSISRAWSEPGTPTEIEQQDDLVTIRHEYMDTVRTVQLGVSEHPSNLTPRFYGHSIGHYEGATLVIDTVGFTAGVLTPHPGILHSEELHTIERLTVDAEEGIMRLEWNAADPKYFKEPLRGTGTFLLSSFPVEEFGCIPHDPD